MRKDFVLHARYTYVPSSSMSTVLILATVFCGPANQLQQLRSCRILNNAKTTLIDTLIVVTN